MSQNNLSNGSKNWWSNRTPKGAPTLLPSKGSIGIHGDQGRTLTTHRSSLDKQFPLHSWSSSEKAKLAAQYMDKGLFSTSGILRSPSLSTFPDAPRRDNIRYKILRDYWHSYHSTKKRSFENTKLSKWPSRRSLIYFYCRCESKLSKNRQTDKCTDRQIDYEVFTWLYYNYNSGIQ